MDMDFQPVEQQLDERVVEIARVAKVVKGGRRFQFRVTIVVGDNHGKIGILFNLQGLANWILIPEIFCGILFGQHDAPWIAEAGPGIAFNQAETE